jgi:hypothetical protein
MTRRAEIELAFGGEDRLFRLPIGRLRALQEKCDAGPEELLMRMQARTYRVDDLRETLYQGLLGGEMPTHEATTLMKNAFDGEPLIQFIPLVQAILMVVLTGAPDEDEEAPPGGATGEAQTNRPSPEESSGSEVSTGPAQPSDGPPAK